MTESFKRQACESYYSEIGNYFFQNEELHDVYFIVGGVKKRIGGVKSQLINQSQVWWTMLSPDSPLKETEDIKVPDIEPEIFNLMLRHCYGGLFDCNALSGDIAEKLCYCANKYDMTTLMKKLAVCLCPSQIKDVFPAINCLVYYNLNDVETAVQKLIANNTKKVIKDPQFLKLHKESVTYICMQKELKCTELELWNAVVKWAKHQVEIENAENLRDCMLKPLKYIRLLALSEKDLFKYVFCEEVLSGKEISCICKKKVSDVTTLCSESTSRYVKPETFNSSMTLPIGLQIRYYQENSVSND